MKKKKGYGWNNIGWKGNMGIGMDMGYDMG
jgi:hypothetical protein